MIAAADQDECCEAGEPVMCEESEDGGGQVSAAV